MWYYGGGGDVDRVEGTSLLPSPNVPLNFILVHMVIIDTFFREHRQFCASIDREQNEAQNTIKRLKTQIGT